MTVLHDHRVGLVQLEHGQVDLGICYGFDLAGDPGAARALVREHAPSAPVVGTVDAVVPVDGVPAVRRVLPLAVAADHRLIDGREAVLALRAAKGMVLDADDHDTWSVGSFFTNPVVPQEIYRSLAARESGSVPHWESPGGVKLAAGWLVERSGFGKGYPGPDAPARLSTKHALALTNRGGATSADIVALARVVRAGVQDAFGITLHPEPVLVGCAL